MEESILTSIKKLLGIEPEYTHFDTDIIIHINSVLMVLNQLGLGPNVGFSIQNANAKWSDFITSDIESIEGIKTYVYLKVKLAFDPPSSPSVIESMKELIREFEWRLNVAAES